MKQLDTPSFDDLFDPTIKALKVLKDLKLGVETKTIEVVDIDHDWFNHL